MFIFQLPAIIFFLAIFLFLTFLFFDFLKLINPYRQLLLRLEAPYPQGTQGKRRRR